MSESNKAKNKKIRFNGMDAFICIVAVVAIIGVYFAKDMFFGTSSGTTGRSETKNVTAVVELTGVKDNLKDAVKVGDIVYVGEKDKVRFTVSGVEAAQAKTTGYDIQNGGVYNSEVPGQYDLKIEITAPGSETDSDISVDDYSIKVGKAEALSAKGWVGYGYTISVEAE